MTDPQMKSYDELVCKQRDEILLLQEQLTRLHEFACGKCGRAALPDGDCYGCEADRLQDKLRVAREALEVAPHPFASTNESQRYDHECADWYWGARKEALSVIEKENHE